MKFFFSAKDCNDKEDKNIINSVFLSKDQSKKPEIFEIKSVSDLMRCFQQSYADVKSDDGERFKVYFEKSSIQKEEQKKKEQFMETGGLINSFSKKDNRLHISIPVDKVSSEFLEKMINDLLKEIHKNK